VPTAVATPQTNQAACCAATFWHAKTCPLCLQRELLRGSQRIEHKLTPYSGRCRAQGSLRGRIARLRMGFFEKMPHWLPARYVRGPRRSLRGHLPFVPAGTPSARAEALSWLVRFYLSRLSATRTRCRCARLRAGLMASFRATATEARFQPTRLARRIAHIFNGHDRCTRVMSTPAASYK
jgi:hypothetical protein